MSETKSNENVLENNGESVTTFKVSPNYKGKNPKTPEELEKIREQKKEKRLAIRKTNGLYESADKMVSHPSHYQMGKFEVIEVIEEATKGLDGIFAVDLGNALKYLLRWNKKGDPKQNLEKAIWEISHMIKKLDEAAKDKT